MVHQNDINNPETIHNFLDFLMQEQTFYSPEERLHLIEYVIDLRQCLFKLVHGMFLLDIMQGTLNIEDL